MLDSVFNYHWNVLRTLFTCKMSDLCCSRSHVNVDVVREKDILTSGWKSSEFFLLNFQKYSYYYYYSTRNNIDSISIEINLIFANAAQGFFSCTMDEVKKKNLLANFDTIVPNVNCLFAYYKVGSRDYGRLVTSIRGIESEIKKIKRISDHSVHEHSHQKLNRFSLSVYFSVFFCIRKNPLSYLATFHYHYHEYACQVERNEIKQNKYLSYS